MISGLKGRTYEERLEELQMDTLETRRKKRDLIQVFKVLKGFDRVDPSQWFEIFEPQTEGVSTRNSMGAYNLVKPKYRLDVRKHFWSQRVIDSWNQLPNEIKLRSSVSSFKTALDAYFQGVYKEAPAINN